MAWRVGWMADGTPVSFNTDRVTFRSPADIAAANIPQAVQDATVPVATPTADTWRIYQVPNSKGVEVNVYSTSFGELDAALS